MTATDPDYLYLGDRKIPYGILENEDDLTTDPGEALGDRLEEVLQKVWVNWQNR
jgi:hypothetical protein